MANENTNVGTNLPTNNKVEEDKVEEASKASAKKGGSNPELTGVDQAFYKDTFGNKYDPDGNQIN